MAIVMLRPSVLCLALAGASLCGALVACGAAGSSEVERYPEKKRPEPLRSASDGEVMGADEVSPEDRLEASPTNEHAAVKAPGAEKPEAEVARERLEHEECEAQNQQAASGADSAPGAPPKKRRLCPPAPPAPGD